MCERCEELEAEIEYLKGRLHLTDDEQMIFMLNSAFRLTRSEARIVARLYASRAPRQAWDLWDEVRTTAKPKDSCGLITAYMLKIRSKIGTDAVRTQKGIGYSLTDAGRELIDQMIDAFKNRTPYPAPLPVRPYVQKQWDYAQLDAWRREGKSYTKIASLTNTTREAVSGALHRLREKQVAAQ